MRTVSHDRLNGASTACCYPHVHPQRQSRTTLIDAFALGLTHFLLAVAVIRLLSRPELDDESAADGKRGK